MTTPSERSAAVGTRSGIGSSRPRRAARAVTLAWVLGVIAVGAVAVRRPDLLSTGSVASALRAWGPWAFVAFAVASAVRGLLLIPSTPFVVAGGALFPGQVGAVLVVSMAGIVLTGVMLHRLPHVAGHDASLAARYPRHLARLQTHLTQPYAVWAVALWAAVPVVPTDLACYAAGLVRMPLARLLTGLVIGELPLVTAYILAGRAAAQALG